MGAEPPPYTRNIKLMLPPHLDSVCSRHRGAITHNHTHPHTQQRKRYIPDDRLVGPDCSLAQTRGWPGTDQTNVTTPAQTPVCSPTAKQYNRSVSVAEWVGGRAARCGGQTLSSKFSGTPPRNNRASAATSAHRQASQVRGQPCGVVCVSARRPSGPFHSERVPTRRTRLHAQDGRRDPHQEDEQ